MAWLPEKQGDNDSFLMQTFASQFTAAEAQMINQCRMFLQVVTVADIATGDGRTVGKTYIEGKRDEHRISNYSWPIQSNPSERSWQVWRKALRTLCQQPNRLIQQLGEWNNNNRSQTFLMRVSSEHQYFYRFSRLGWRRHKRVEQHLRRPKYQWQSNRVDEPSPAARKATATVIGEAITEVLDRPGRQCQQLKNQNRKLLLRDAFLRHLPKAHERLLGEYKVPADQGQSIANSLATRSIIAVSDGSVKDGKGAHAWCVQGATEEKELTAAGPTDGDPERMSSFRAELSGVAAILLIIHHLLTFHKPAGPLMGHLNIFCDNETVV
ncbi:MAG: hypothetical protein ACREBR_03650, partial [bacterium]